MNNSDSIIIILRFETKGGVKAPVHWAANFGSVSVKNGHGFLAEASFNRSYPMNLKIELARDYTFFYRKIFFFHQTFFSTPLGSVFEPILNNRNKKIPKNQKTDNLKRRAWKDLELRGMGLLVTKTSFPILGASPTRVLRI